MQGFCLSELNLTNSEKESLLGMHAFSDNDFMSSFFLKSKVHCWKIMKTDEFEEPFKLLRNSKGCHDTECLAKYVCKLYGLSDTSVNRVRFKIVEKKYQNDNNNVDISLLPPYCSTLRLHILRANTIAYFLSLSLSLLLFLYKKKVLLSHF